jgi:hypothetical protein
MSWTAVVLVRSVLEKLTRTGGGGADAEPNLAARESLHKFCVLCLTG